LAKVSTVLQAPIFKKTVKKLKPNQKKELDAAIKRLMAKPTLGELKKGDLAFLRVYKFKMSNQLRFLGYSYDDGALTLELIALATRENFYLDVKRRS